MGQAISSGEDQRGANNNNYSSNSSDARNRKPVAHLSESSINRLFIKSCLKQFDAYELYCLKKNLLDTADTGTDTAKNVSIHDQPLLFEDITGSLIHKDKLNEFLKIPSDHQIFNIFFSFLKQIARFPLMAPPLNENRHYNPERFQQEAKRYSDSEYFEFGEIIKILVLFTKKREIVLGKYYNFNKLFFIALSIAGAHDGISECYPESNDKDDARLEDTGSLQLEELQHAELSEKEAEEATRKSLATTNVQIPYSETDDIIREFNEKTGDVEIRYPIYERKIVWSNLPLVCNFNGIVVEHHCVPSTYLLNFFTLLLLVQSSVAEALYHSTLSNILTVSSKKSGSALSSKPLESISRLSETSSTDFSSITARIEENKVKNVSKDRYNLYKVNAFNMIKSINRDNNVKHLLSKNAVFKYSEFSHFVSSSAPYLLDNLNNLFLSFTYFVDHRARKASKIAEIGNQVENGPVKEKIVEEQSESLFNQFPESKLMNLQNIAQLSTFLSLDDDTNSSLTQSNAFSADSASVQGNTEDHRSNNDRVSITPVCNFNINNCRNLYIGSKFGFSMKSFEFKVFNWNAPSMLLISGKKIMDPVSYGAKNNSKFLKFDQHYPNLIHKSKTSAGQPIVIKNGKPGSNLRHLEKATTFSRDRLSEPNKREKVLGETVVYGVYINKPWRKTNKNFFADDKTVLFQLAPKQNLFKAKKSFSRHANYAYFNTEGGGIGFGSAQPIIKNNALVKYQPGNVSLTIDSNLEFAVFRHTDEAALFHHGSIYDGPVPHGQGSATSYEVNVPVYEDKFLINEIEVWGIGSSEVFKQQLAHWAWEEREAEKRNRVNLKSLGEERAFLEMAGLVGNNNASGGSV